MGWEFLSNELYLRKVHLVIMSGMISEARMIC